MNLNVLTRFKLAVVLFIILIQNKIISLFRYFLFRRFHSDIKSNINKILIFRTGSLGDSITILPSIHAINLNFPNSQIDILTNAGSKNLVSIKLLLDSSYYSEIIDYDGLSFFKLFSIIRKRKYDLVIQLPQQYAGLKSQIRDMIFFKFAGLKFGMGWQITSSLLLKKTQEVYATHLSEREIHLRYLENEGFTVESSKNKFPLNFSISDINYVDDLLNSNSCTYSKPSIAVIIGSKRPQNRWPLSYFKLLIDKLAFVYNVFLIGGYEDFDSAETLLQRDVYNYCGRLTPIQSAILLSKCKFTISNDTGPMHLSYAVSTPVIALFSSRDFPGRWYPPNELTISLFRNDHISCSLCLSDVCKNNLCMQGISPETVLKSIPF